MMKRIQRYAKYKILRHRAGNHPARTFTPEEMEIVNFVNATLRTGESITISGNVIKATKGDLQLSMESGRLRAVNDVKNSVMDVKLNDAIADSIKEYAKRIVKHRAFTFNKCCARQISTLIDGFQE